MIDRLREYYYYIKNLGIINAVKFAFLEVKKTGTVSLKLKNYKNLFVLRANTSDSQTFKQIFLRGDYEIEVNFKPKYIVDAGAYIGLSSVYFANRFPEAKIIAIEPAEINYSLLLKNIHGYENIEPVNKGIWYKKTYLTVINEGHGEWGFIVKETNDKNEADIQATSIDEILEDFGMATLDIVKLDIEGSEVEVFSNNYQWLSKVKMLIVELHENLRPGCTEVLRNAIGKYSYSDAVSGENMVLINQSN